MMSDEELNQKLDEAIKKEAHKEVSKSKALTFYALGFQTATIIFMIAILVKQVWLK